MSAVLASAPPRPDKPRLRVMIVDDSVVVRGLVARWLAEDGSLALESCRAEMPDAILLDWNMPVMDGYEFLKQLRLLPRGEGPKVVFCTTENDVAHIARAMRAGADEYIMKPFDKEIMTAKLQEVGLY